MKSKRLIVISLDALGSTDFEMFSQLPNFKKFIDHAAFCRQVRSVYPSLTYPAHTTIVTGRPPAEQHCAARLHSHPKKTGLWRVLQNPVRPFSLRKGSRSVP